MKRFFYSLFSISALLLALSACQDDEQILNPPPTVTEGHPILPDIPFNYANPDLPDYFFHPGIQSADNMPPDNPVTDHGATLGRVLFYDVNLSLNRTISCASCHRQENGFSDPDQFSIGFLGGLTPRHSMSLANARYYPGGRFFWDERAASLEEQVLHHIQDKIEMGMTLNMALARVDSLPYYAELFELAFGTREVTPDRISRALAQFVRSMVSFRSPYDKGRALVDIPAEPFPTFTPAQNRGKAIFFGPRGGCAPCHNTDLMIAFAPVNNGLDIFTTDPGLAAVTGRKTDEGLFKVPSLRNIAIRPPYMHDGRFSTLEQVIEHYSSGIQNHPNLSSPLRTAGGMVRQANFTDAEKADLLAFLHTLTDEEFVVEEKFGKPFR